MCPRSSRTTSRSTPCFVRRSWWNSWWTCQRPPSTSPPTRGQKGDSGTVLGSSWPIVVPVPWAAWGLLVEVGHTTRPVDPLPPLPGKAPPPAKGGAQILGKADACGDGAPWTSVVDVPVIKQLKFQQSLPIDNEMVPQIPFIDRLEHPVMPQRRVYIVHTVQKTRDPTVQFLVGRRRSLDHAATNLSSSPIVGCANCAENRRVSTVAWLWTSLRPCSDVRECLR